MSLNGQWWPLLKETYRGVCGLGVGVSAGRPEGAPAAPGPYARGRIQHDGTYEYRKLGGLVAFVKVIDNSEFTARSCFVRSRVVRPSRFGGAKLPPHRGAGAEPRQDGLSLREQLRGRSCAIPTAELPKLASGTSAAAFAFWIASGMALRGGASAKKLPGSLLPEGLCLGDYARYRGVRWQRVDAPESLYSQYTDVAVLRGSTKACVGQRRLRAAELRANYELASTDFGEELLCCSPAHYPNRWELIILTHSVSGKCAAEKRTGWTIAQFLR